MKNGGNAASTIDILDMDCHGGRAHLADIGSFSRKGVKFRKIKVQFSFVGNGQRMQNSVGAASHRKIKGKGVEQCVSCQNIPRSDIFVDQIDNPAGGFPDQIIATGVDCKNGAIARQGKAKRFAEAVHGVGREHART